SKTKSEHDHPRHPEKEDVESGGENVGRIEDAQVGGVVGPAHRRKRPESRREPGVEYVCLLRDLGGTALRTRRRVVDRYGHVAICTVEGRDAMAPPELAGNRP